MDLSESQSSSSHTQAESEGPCLIVQDSQKEQDIPGTSHKQKMLWEMTALQGDQNISPVLDQVKQSSSKKSAEKKDTSKDESASASTSGPPPVAPPWNITKMPSIPPKHKDSHSSSTGSSSMGSVYPVSSHDTSSSSRNSTLSSLGSSDSSGAGKKTSPQSERHREAVSSKTRSKGTAAVAQVIEEADENISLSQEDMFPDAKAETTCRERTRHTLLGTPSETIPSLQLSGQIVYVNETSTSDDASPSVIPPSPEAWGPLPVIIPSTPTPDEEEPMDVSLDYSEGDVQQEGEGLVIGETQQQPAIEVVEKEKVLSQKTKPKHKRGVSEGSMEDDMRIPAWQQALNKEEEEAAASGRSSDASRSESNASRSTHSSDNNSMHQSDYWAQQSESMGGQNVQQQQLEMVTTEESVRSRPGSTKSPIVQVKETTASPVVKPAEQPEITERTEDKDEHMKPTEPQFSEDLFNPEVPQESERAEIDSEPSVMILSQSQEQQASQQASQAQQEKDKPPSDDWSLRLTPSQSDTQSQGIYLTRKGLSSQSEESQTKQATAEKEHEQLSKRTVDVETSRQDVLSPVLSSQQKNKDVNKQDDESGRQQLETSAEVSRTSGGGSQWDESIVQSAPRQSQSVDPSQLSGIGFQLSLPPDSGLRPITSVTPPVDKRKKERTLRTSRQPRHSTPITEEDNQGKDQGDTPTGVPKVQQPTSTLTLEEGVESQQQDSNDLPKFRLAKPSDTDQLVKTAKESPSKKSASVFAKVQETKAASVPKKAVPKKARKQIRSLTASTGESDDPFALPPDVTRSRSVDRRQQQQQGTEQMEQDESEVITAPTVPESDARLVPGDDQPEKQVEQEEDDEATIPMVYEEATSAAVAGVQETEEQEQSESRKTSDTTKKRGKKGAPGSKKRKKPTRSKEGGTSADQPQEPSSSIDQPAPKQSRVERDPYEWTESQSNKTPTPLKIRRGVDADEEMTLARRRLNEPAEDQGHVEAVSAAGEGSSTGTRKSAAGEDKGDDGAPKDSTPSKEQGDGTQLVHDDEESPSKQQTPPVRRDNDTSESGMSEDSIREPLRNVGITRQVTTVVMKTICTVRIVTEKVYKDGTLIDCNVQESNDAPIVEREVEEHFSPSFGSSNTSASLTSGSLADISSLSTSKSSSGTPSLQKTSSSSSSNLTKTSTISSISREDSSLGKEVSSGSPGSNKTSPNTSKGSATPGSPKLRRSVSFQDEQGGRQSPSKSKSDKSVDTAPGSDKTIQRTSLTRAATLPSPPSEQEQRLITRSSTDILPRQKESVGKSGKKSVFTKTYSLSGKRGLRMRGSGDKDTGKERKKTATGDSAKDSDDEEEPKRPQRRQRRARSTEKNGAKSPLLRSPEEQSLPTTLPTPSFQTEPSVTETGGGGTRSETTTSTSGPSSSLSKSSSSKAEILATPPCDPGSPGTDTTRHNLAPGTRVLAKWLDAYYYAGKIKGPTKDSKHEVIFDDGDVRNIPEKNIIVKEWLSKGQSVLVTKEDSYSYPGVVIGYYNDVDTGEQGYAVETDRDHETKRYARGKVILTRDQASSLFVSSSGSATSSSEINLDNVVSGKRTRGRFVLSPDGSPRGRKVSTGGQSGAERGPLSPQPGPSRQSAKRKLLQGPSSRSSSPVPKKGRGLIASSPSTSDAPISPRRSPRKNPVAPSPSISRPLTGQERLKSMGPIPTNKLLFKGLAFLITSCSERKKKVFMGRSPSYSTDESGVEEESLEPIDKSYAAEQIKTAGGIVLSSFDKSQITKCKVFLISNAYCRTTKYLQALAAGIQCLSHFWLRDCINQNIILGYEAYMLPAGLGLDGRTLFEQQPQRCILAGMHIYVISTKGYQDEWRKVLIAAGCQVVKRLPTHALRQSGKEAFDCEVIVTDRSCPRHILDKALHSIPVVSAEWLMQCLIHSKRFGFRDSPKFAWDWIDPDTL